MWLTKTPKLCGSRSELLFCEFKSAPPTLVLPNDRLLICDVVGNGSDVTPSLCSAVGVTGATVGWMRVRVRRQMRLLVPRHQIDSSIICLMSSGAAFRAANSCSALA